MTYYIIHSNTGVAYTDSKEKMEQIVNGSFAYLMGYRVETTSVEPKFLDKYI